MISKVEWILTWTTLKEREPDSWTFGAAESAVNKTSYNLYGITVISGVHGDVTDENPGGNMKKIIYSGIQLFFGQLENVYGRQRDFTGEHTFYLLETMRAVFRTVLHYNNKQPKESQMSMIRLVVEFTRVLWYKFVGFLKNTALGQWIVHYVWRQLIFTRENAAKFAVFGVAVYLCWRYWGKHNGVS